MRMVALVTKVKDVSSDNKETDLKVFSLNNVNKLQEGSDKIWNSIKSGYLSLVLISAACFHWYS